MKAVAVGFSVAWPAESRERPDGDVAAGRLAMFRGDLYRYFTLRADALFELDDAVLAAGRVPSLPYLSEEPAFRRSHGMVYQGLARGRIDEDALRDLLVRWRPAGGPRTARACSASMPRRSGGRGRSPARAGSSITTAAPVIPDPEIR